MSWLTPISNWFSDHQALVWWLSAGSLALFLLTPLLMAWLITRLPVDYFRQRRRRPLGSWDDYPALRYALLAAKCMLGAILLLIGVIMLVAPGQGLLMIVAGLVLLEFPGKYRLERWLITRRHVWRSINWLRRRAGKPELKSPLRCQK
jgi:hypothetical protein